MGPPKIFLAAGEHADRSWNFTGEHCGNCSVEHSERFRGSSPHESWSCRPFRILVAAHVVVRIPVRSRRRLGNLHLDLDL